MRAIRIGIASLLCVSALGGCGGKTAQKTGPDFGADEVPPAEMPSGDRDSSGPAPGGGNSVAGTTSTTPRPEPMSPSQGGSPGYVGVPSGDAGEPGSGRSDAGQPGSADAGAGPTDFPPNSVSSEVEPDATATVRFLPEFGLLELAPVGDSVQSTYFKTTPENREFRRGVMEFQVPKLSGRAIASATLALTPGGGWSSIPFPPEAHRVYAYQGDGQVTVEDYGAEGILLGIVETDENDEVKPRLDLDITQQVEAFRGRRMTVRVQPDLSDDYAVFDVSAFRGAGFWLQEIIIIHHAL